MPRFDDLEIAGETDVGIRRSHNQDAFSIQKAPDKDYWQKVGHVLIVADGMGGHAVGEKASAMAVQEIPLTYAKHAHEGILNALRRAFQEANSGIFAIGQSNPEFKGLGTTGTALILREEGAWVAHVGDSRAYRVRDGKIEQLTFDHSYAWEMARRLGVPPEDLSDVKKNVIIRSLGPDVLVQVDVEGPYPLFPGDTFVLCSDGLSNQVTPEEVGSIVSALSPSEAGKFMIELANLRGGPDNITAVIARIGGDEASTKAMSIKPASPFKVLCTRLWHRWNQFIPWPLMVLAAGFLCAVGAVVFEATETRGSSILIAFAALAIIGGLVGLVFHAKKQRRDAEREPELPRRQNVYRDYPCRIERPIVDKLLKLGAHLKEQLEGRPFQVDWSAYKKYNEAAQRSLQEGDLLASFREQCKALIGLARTFNKNRPREEGFKPKWETTAEA
ncbi:MAG: protein phosphatase 2C domain-containing protein [Planctomycetes bacterium]|nr:protein phosphatase 2C domain-containing protein [Planctomycetota bacterium]